MSQGGVQGRVRGERGAVGLEYTAMVVVAAMLVGAVFIAVGSGDRIVNAVEVAVCKILGGEDCGARTSDITEALPSCEVYTKAYDMHGEATVFSVNLGGDGQLTLKKDVAPDGTERWLVEEAVGGQAGGHGMVGEKGKFGIGEGLSAEAKALLTGKGSRTFAFDSEAEAREYIETAPQRLGREAVSARSILPDSVDERVFDTVTGTSYEDLGEPVSYYVEGGQKVTAGADASAGVAGAAVSTEKANVLGLKYEPGSDRAGDRTTVYYKGSQKLAGELGALGRGPNGDVEGEVVVAVTMEDGSPVSAKVEAAGKVRAGFFSKGDMDLPLGKSLPKGAVSAGLDGGAYTQGRVAFELDLTNRDNLDALADVTESTGMDIFPEHGTPGYQGPAEAVTGLKQRFTQGGPTEGATVTGQRFEGSEAQLEVGFFAGDLVAFGAGGHVGTSTSEATDAFYYAPGAGFVQWQGCDGR